jgi:voltage-dependent potassium channel beta subunit
MQYRNVGKSGLKVSAISIGGWLTFGDSVGEGDVARILRRALGAGVNFVDLADVYGGGSAEEVCGRVLKDVPRTSLVVSSKVFWPMGDGPNDRGLSRKHVFESVDASLRRLGTDYLDLYFCHRWDDDTPLEETVRAMDDLIRAGKVLYWGTSMWTGPQLQAAHKVAHELGLRAPIVEQPRYNLLDRRIEADVMPTVTRLGMGLTVWSPLAQGILTGKYDAGRPEGTRGATTAWLEADLHEANLDRVRKLGVLAREVGATPARLALGWLLTRPAVACVITGATRTEQLDDNLAAASLELGADVWAAVERLFS